MEQKRCFFIGHRDAPDELYSALIVQVERHIREFGVTEFVVGQYGRFDKLAAKAVIAAKCTRPEVQLTLLLPYHPAERPVQKPDGFDGTYYPPAMETVPRRLAIVRANRYMVEHADYLIAYAWQSASNARTMLEYARQRAKRGLLNITELPQQMF